ncbi:MAG: coiled-coil protein [Caldisphaera sp.]|nr:hypothetical protein [Caldisphaera sp.]PMP89227.1 MAG: hypothetical protein C0172_00625 [Caldisphaera sp.]
MVDQGQGQQNSQITQKEVDEESFLKHIDEIKDKIIEIKNQRSQLIDEIKSLRDKRRQLIEEKKKLVDRLINLREERKKLLDELVKAKQDRETASKEFKTKLDQLKVAHQLTQKEGDFAKLSLRRIQKRMEELEWRQQTSVLTPEEEKRLVEEIDKLEELAERVRKAREEEVSVLELEADVKGLKLKLTEAINKVKELREKIGRLKGEISSLTPKIDEYNKNIDSLAAQIQQKSQDIESLSKQLDALYQEYRDHMVKLKEMKLAKQHGIQVNILEQKRKEIEEKQKKGEALTLDELRILYGDLDSI